jgi:hypothetical protein
VNKLIALIIAGILVICSLYYYSKGMYLEAIYPLVFATLLVVIGHSHEKIKKVN